MEEKQPSKPNNNHLKGFAAHPENINRGGRPKGSRNKASLKLARELMDTDSLEAAQTLAAIMRNDKEFLGTSVDVKMETRAKVAADIINKSIASAKDNEHIDSDGSKKGVLGDSPIEDEDDENVSFQINAIQ